MWDVRSAELLGCMNLARKRHARDLGRSILDLFCFCEIVTRNQRRPRGTILLSKINDDAVSHASSHDVPPVCPGNWILQLSVEQHTVVCLRSGFMTMLGLVVIVAVPVVFAALLIRAVRFVHRHENCGDEPSVLMVLTSRREHRCFRVYRTQPYRYLSSALTQNLFV